METHSLLRGNEELTPVRIRASIGHTDRVGLDVIHRIENAKTYKDKPVDDIKILNIDIA